MKTIEVNLIGDLKQKTVSKKMTHIPKAVSDKDATPQQNRNNMILLGVSGSAFLLLALFIIISLGCFIWGLFLNNTISQTEEDIEQKNKDLKSYTKVKEKLNSEAKELANKNAIKKYFETTALPLGDILEELRAKVPNEIYLTKISKGKKGITIQGSVSSDSINPLKSISLFLVNIKDMKPDKSLVRDAYLSKSTNKNGTYTFSIIADVKRFVPPPPVKKDEKKTKAR